MDGRTRRGADTRERIVHAVWSVIAEEGIAGLTTRKVANRAGISHGMCHYHFATKDQLVLAVVRYARHYWIHPLEALVSSTDPSLRKLEGVITWMAEPATREVMRVHLQLMSQSEYNDTLRQAMAGEYARWNEGYARLFRELESDGQLIRDCDASEIGVGFATLADGLVDQMSLGTEVVPEAIMRAFLRPFVPGLEGSSASHVRPGIPPRRRGQRSKARTTP